ncbi:VOC family protein [Enterobacter sp. 148H3]|uniref:VOC family protein n=1 Tax=Enterobacter sp. 148H3 TaxID=3077756 RepID=UPI00215BF475|nr:VOC family protein [Enterobacter sp. 148H3]
MLNSTDQSDNVFDWPVTLALQALPDKIAMRSFPDKPMKGKKMNELLPSAALAHFVMKVNDVDASYAFYQGLGLRALDKFPGMAIIELRGGTHLLLTEKDVPETQSLHISRVGQRPDFAAEKIDLMIAGHSRSELETYRTGLIAKGYSAQEIAQETLFGHHYFSLQDPDGNGISFYTSHCSQQPV